MRWLTALATTLLTTSAFVAPPRTRLHALTGATATDDATDQLLDSWLLDNLGSCAVPIDDDDDDAFELCSVDSPTAVWKSTRVSGAVEVDATIQHEHALKFDFHTGQQRAASTCTTCWPLRSRARRRRRRGSAFDGGRSRPWAASRTSD